MEGSAAGAQTKGSGIVSGAGTLSLPASLTGPQEHLLTEVLYNGELGGLQAVSDVAACLVPLLKALGWRGDPRHIAEALPHFADSFDVEDLQTVLANLGYSCRSAQIRLAEINPELLPCLFIPKAGSATIILGRDTETIEAFDGSTDETTRYPPGQLTGTGYFFKSVDPGRGGAKAAPNTVDWFQTMARRFRGLAWQLFGVSLLCNLLAIGVPLFTMAIYDWVIPSRSSETLYFLGFGVLFLIVVESLSRLMRGRYLAYIGGRIDAIIGTAAFQRIINLPVIMTERSSNGAQMARLRQFESIREFFTGPLAGVFFDLPFVVVFIVAIAWIAGPVAWIPLALAAIFLLSATIIIPASKRAVAECGEARSARQSLVVEAFSNLRSIKSCNGEQVWKERFRDLSARAADASFRSSQISSIAQTMGQSLMLSAGVATLAYGTVRVMSAEMTVGALVASMALVWRALGPLQTGFLCLLRFEHVILGLRQLNMLMKLAPEREPDRFLDPCRTLRGEVIFHQVSMRYSPQGEPALMGVGFRVSPGQIVAITGPSGSGKSTILKLIAGLYKPQAGAVLIDGIDIRQLDCAELRNAIAFVPQSCHLFHGTLAQNLRLANPIASDDAVAEAARDAALLDDILALPEGFNTRLTDQLQRQLPSSFRQRLMLARAYIKRAPLFLLDEPGRTLDSDSDTALMRKLAKLRESATVFMVTQRPSHLRLADQVFVLDRGQVIDGGPPDVILPKLGMG